MNCGSGTTDRAPLVRHQAGDSPAAVAIVRAVAAVENEPPTSLTPLGDVVDAEALETLLDGSDSVGRVAFEYAGYRVVATGDMVELYESR